MIETFLYILAIVVAVLVAVVFLLYAMGRAMDPKHEHTCTMRLNKSADAVFALVNDVANWPRWDKGVPKVEMLPPTNGQETCRMWIGRNPMVLVTTRREPPRVLERTIQDVGKHQMFSGRWIHEITPHEGGCVVKLTEKGTIHMALPRALARKLADPAMYLKRHLKVLAANFGESPTIETVVA